MFSHPYTWSKNPLYKLWSYLVENLSPSSPSTPLYKALEGHTLHVPRAIGPLRPWACANQEVSRHPLPCTLVWVDVYGLPWSHQKVVGWPTLWAISRNWWILLTNQLNWLLTKRTRLVLGFLKDIFTKIVESPIFSGDGVSCLCFFFAGDYIFLGVFSGSLFRKNITILQRPNHVKEI